MCISINYLTLVESRPLTLLVERQEGQPACKTLGVGVMGCRFDWSFAYLIYSSCCHHSPPPPLKIQNEDTLIPANPGLPGKKIPLKRRGERVKTVLSQFFGYQYGPIFFLPICN